MRQNNTTGKSPKPVQTSCQKYFAFVVGQISGLTPPSHPMRGALRTSRTRGGMRWTQTARETHALMRTVKSRGSGAAVLALSLREGAQATEAKEPFSGKS